MFTRLDDSSPQAARTAVAALTLLTAAALAVAPRHAEAQLLKRVKQAAQDRLATAAVEKGAEKAGVAPTDGAGGGSGAGAPPAPTRGSSRLEITTERIDAFLVAIKPIAAEAQRKKLEAARQADYQARVEKMKACAEPVQARLQASGARPSAAGVEASKAPMDRYSAYQEKAAGLYATDPHRAAALQDSASGAMYEASLAMFPALKACGGWVYAPAPLPGAPAPGTPAPKPALPDGMTATQFGRLRERIAAFVVTNGTGADVNDAERAALAAKQGALAPYAALFKDGTLEWQSWGDLTGEW